jgi:EAL domain-containing protein (putative c-di-GMP-specific phosphodiesterase class I)
MSLIIVAEGVEHISQLKFLKDQGCDKAQGFLFSKPVTEEDFEKILRGKLIVDKY